MKVAIFGGTGMLGFAVAKFLSLNGFGVDIISRKPTKYLNKKKYKGFNIIEKLDESTKYNVCINLAGLSLFRRWNDSNKKEFLDSRTSSVAKIIDYALKSGNKFELIINGSAIGFYPSNGDVVNEYTDVEINKNSFAQKLCIDVERESLKLCKVSNQLINVRTGVVIAKDGGFLARLLPAFKFGLGSIIGGGKQYMSWIDINDFCRAFLFIITNQGKFEDLDFINLTAPNFSTNEEFSKYLAKVLHRPCMFKIPKFIVKLIFGQMGTELMLCSQRVYPKKLIDTGFNFEYDTLLGSIKFNIDNKRTWH
jgi:uncharacterized protein (TIGR01777 family)